MGKLVKLGEDGGSVGGVKIADVVTVNGARVMLENGGWGLVRASSNTPNLVVVCESPESDAQMRAIFADLDALAFARTESVQREGIWLTGLSFRDSFDTKLSVQGRDGSRSGRLADQVSLHSRSCQSRNVARLTQVTLPPYTTIVTS